jgi:hypothetical protein
MAPRTRRTTGGAPARCRDPSSPLLIEPTLGVSVTPTRISASEKVNVFPVARRAAGRLSRPAGARRGGGRARIEELLGPDGYRIGVPRARRRQPLAAESPLMDEIKRWVDEQDPGAQTDAHDAARLHRLTLVSQRLPPTAWPTGSPPPPHDDPRADAAHPDGADERIDVRDLGYAASFFHDLPQRLLG